MIVYCPAPSVFCTTGPTPLAAAAPSGSARATHAYETTRRPGAAALVLPSMTTFAAPPGPAASVAPARGDRKIASRRAPAPPFGGAGAGAGGSDATVGGGGQ